MLDYGNKPEMFLRDNFQNCNILKVLCGGVLLSYETCESVLHYLLIFYLCY